MHYYGFSSGATMFDACHAYGLGVLLAHATSAPVQLAWEGVGYRFITSATTAPTITPETTLNLLALPDAAAVERATTFTDPPVTLGNLDGLLAATFTTTGKRLVSVRNALHNRENLDAQACAAAITKAQALIVRLGSYLERQERRTPGGLAALLMGYASDEPVLPILKTKQQNNFTIPMTLDPLVSFAARQPLSDGRITQNTNLAIATLPLSTPLAFVGAARFLRGQRCVSRLVNLYLPLPQQMTITATTCLPLLAGTSLPAQQALATRWLAHANPPADERWRALSCHTLQTQGSSQSITRAVGVVDYEWLATLQQRAGDEVGAYWRFALHQSRTALPYDLDTLVDCLLHRSGAAWRHHLDDIADVLAADPDANVRSYTDRELKEVTAMLPTADNLSLRVVLANDHGTQRFGHALRQLGRYHASALREYAEELDAVRDLDGLLRLLAQMSQMCEVLKAKSPFLIVPTDDDLDLLLADVEQFGARRIVSVLLILAVLRYPKEEKATHQEPSDTQSDEAREQDDEEEREGNTP